jgi:dihydrofolate reductase
MDENRLIGAENRLPWRLPDDMVWFKEKTMGKPVLMGRKTYESIPVKFRPFAGRHNIVLTRNMDYEMDGVTVVHDLETAVSAAGNVPEIIIAGGANIYEQFLPQVDRMYLTLINGRFPGNTCFPPFSFDDWRQTWTYIHNADERHSHDFTWVILDRKSSPIRPF